MAVYQHPTATAPRVEDPELSIQLFLVFSHKFLLPPYFPLFPHTIHVSLANRTAYDSTNLCLPMSITALSFFLSPTWNSHLSADLPNTASPMGPLPGTLSKHPLCDIHVCVLMYVNIYLLTHTPVCPTPHGRADITQTLNLSKQG